jgi:sporulation protein YlmC with PRC-barrel domain
MELFVIRRRQGWRTPEELQAAAERSTQEGERRGDVRWIRSYVVQEDDGQLGTVCIYEAESEDAIRGHAKDAGLPADEVVKVADTVIVRPDPQPATAG